MAIEDWQDYDWILARLISDYTTAKTKHGWGTDERVDAYVHWMAYEDHDALGHIIEAVKWCLGAISSMLDINTLDLPVHKSGFIFYWDYHLQTTYKSIAEAWIKNDFEGRVVTIAVIDRMRQILWDEPFQVLWAARPEDKI